jgi:hypothetical protein
MEEKDFAVVRALVRAAAADGAPPKQLAVTLSDLAMFVQARLCSDVCLLCVSYCSCAPRRRRARRRRRSRSRSATSRCSCRNASLLSVVLAARALLRKLAVADSSLAIFARTHGPGCSRSASCNQLASSTTQHDAASACTATARLQHHGNVRAHACEFVFWRFDNACLRICLVTLPGCVVALARPAMSLQTCEMANGRSTR